MTSPLSYVWSLLGAVRKDAKRLFSSRISAGLLVIGPLLMISLVGFAFQSTELSGVTIGVYSDVSGLEETVGSMITAQGFNATFYDDEDTCVEDNKAGKTAVCVTLSQEEEQLVAGVNLDFSRPQFAGAVLSQVKDIVNQIKSQRLSEFGDSLTEGAGSITSKLDDFEQGLARLRSNINQTKQSVQAETANLSLGVENKSLGDIPELQRNLAEASTRLRETNNYLSQVEGDIESNKEAIDEQISFAEDLAEQRSCNDSYPAILDIDSQDRVAEILQNASKPECVLIWNYKEYFDRRSNTLDEIQSEIERQQSQVSRYQAEAQEASNTSVGSVVGDEIDQVKQEQRRAAANLTSGLNRILSSLDNSTDEVRRFQNASFIDTLQDADDAVNPVSVQVNRYKELRGVTMLDLLFPGILTCLAAFVGILVGSVLVMKERTSNAGFRNAISPIPTWFLQFSTTITGSLISASQILIVLAAAVFAFGLNAQFPATLVPFLVFGGGVFTLLGQVIGRFSPNQEVSTLLSIIVAVTFMLFSSLIMPLEKMHPLLADVFAYSPFNLVMNPLRRMLIFGESAFAFLSSLAWLVGYAALSVSVLLASKVELGWRWLQDVF